MKPLQKNWVSRQIERGFYAEIVKTKDVKTYNLTTQTPLRVEKKRVCPFVLFLLAIVLSFRLRYTDSDCPFGIFKLFFDSSAIASTSCLAATSVSQMTTNIFRLSFRNT
jgi:hypothetical protein